MFKKNSMFIKILLPVTVIMLIQALLISFVLFINGTVETLESGAERILVKNAENRGNALETYMLHSRSSLDNLEIGIQFEIEKYLTENKLQINNLTGNSEHETNLLYEISDSLLHALRIGQTTGVFMFFSEPHNNHSSGEQKSYNGIYFRDSNPMSTPMDYSDIALIKGSEIIFKKHTLLQDPLWEASFILSTDEIKYTDSFAKPLNAAKENPELSAVNLSYWAKPYILYEKECVTYTRPVIYDGQIIGIIGTEIQIDWLKRSFPSADFDNTGKSGYILVSYSDSVIPFDVAPNAATGSFIRTHFGEQDSLTFNKGESPALYLLKGKNGEKAQSAFHPLRLYGENSAFYKDKWALTAVQHEDLFFSATRSVLTGILISTLCAFIGGIILLAFTVRFALRPITALTKQVNESNPNAPIELSKNNTHEIALLCDSLNEARNRSAIMENLMQEERERYLIVLENAADTFTEYDTESDCFIIFFFEGEKNKSALTSMVIDSFTERVKNGDICHSEDIENHIAYLEGRLGEFEFRIVSDVSDSMGWHEKDDSYCWVSQKASYIYNDEGNIKRIIGTAKHITKQKLNEKEKIEASRRDKTTGLYNRVYGLNHIRKTALNVKNNRYALCVICLDGFKAIENYYGRIFGAIILREFCRNLSAVKSDGDILIRAENDILILYINNANQESVVKKTAQVIDAARKVYHGENADLSFNARIGVSVSEDGEEDCAYANLLKGAYDTMFYAIKNNKSQPVYFSEHPMVPPEFSTHIIQPVSVEIDISRETILTVTSEAFERSTDIPSVVNALLGLIGELYQLNLIIICSFDLVLKLSRIPYQWNVIPDAPLIANTEDLSGDEFDGLRQLLNQDGILEYNTKITAGYKKGITKLLCVSYEENFSALGCAVYENAVHSGMIIFKNENAERNFTESEKYMLNEITKMISAHISIQKSNTASKAKGDFLSQMSHEIRTPMNAIIGMTDLAKQSSAKGDNEKVADCVEKIGFSSKHLLSLINDILDISKIESGMLKLMVEPFSLSFLAETVAVMLRPQIEAKGVKLLLNIKNKHNDVIGDEYRLRQVLMNFISNAAKFTPKGGEIHLTIEEQEPEKNFTGSKGWFKFSVRDTGMGISDEDKPKIFKAFEQASHNTGAHGGTGLGLAISVNIISSMGGKIELESEVGKGSDFFFTIELEIGEESKDKAVQGQKFDYKNRFKGKRVLLAEDNEINTEIAVCILETAGLEIETAADGKEAINKFFASEENHFDVILMDIQMPEMNGIEATRAIRKSENRADAHKIPIIAMTANAFDEDGEKSIEAGMNAHVSKPIDNDRLFSLLRDIIGVTE
ncbi:MAG: ATP-binding protein [Oscillospiraceae bacterium]|nr:ATP-binding protein [Oscillospiraceae bacterium]